MKFTGERYVPGIGGSIALEHEHRYRFCLDFVSGRRVLDIACGEGFGSAMIAEHAEKVWGVDIDRQAVSHAVARYSHDNLQYLVGSCSNIPLPDASVDVVVSFETIEHHDNHDGMMNEILRVMRPGGVLIISSPDKRVYSDERGFRNEFHVKELYADEFDALLRGRFAHVAMFGQRIVYGSALLPEGSPGALQSWGIDQTKPVSGLHAPMFKVAVASDDPSWAALARGGLLEDTVYRSEAIIERTENGRREATEQTRRAEDAVQELLRVEADRAEQARRAEQSSQEVLRLQADLAAQNQRTNDLQETVNTLWREWYGSTILRRMVFHRSGKPRGWARKLLLKDKSGTPRPALRRVLFKKNGTIRPPFARWYAPFMAHSGKGSTGLDYVQFLGSRIASGDLAATRTVHVVTTPHTEFIGEGLAAALRNTRLTVTRSTEMPAAFDHDLYIVVAPQMFATLPPPDKLIAVQVEQVRASRWVDESYLARLQNSLAILDYSRDNIDALIKRGIPSKQIYYMPIRPLRREGQPRTERDIDVLFYGAIGSDRRGQYINALAKRVNLRVESDTFGPALRSLLDRTKIVVNVHFYENALLETTRIGEALSHGAHVVSEDAIDQTDHTSYGETVDFVPRNEVETFVQRVEAALASWQGPVDLPQDDGFDGMSFHVLRALHGIGVLSLAELQAACRDMVLPSDRMILALPEQVQRYDAARRGRLPGAVPFHGLRQLLGWQGCAASYKFLATQALAQDLRHLTIYEDDAIFDPGADQRLTAIETHLDTRNDWDIFSGLLTDLHSDAQVTGVSTAAGEEFIELDSVIGMVFGIYSRHGLQMLANFEFEGHDTAVHTIDRWLERRSPRTLTVMPPLAGHDESLTSTLWPVNNSQVASMIHDSVKRLEEKRAAFWARQKAAETSD
ncbi:methyltransferase domain-containing protein [Pseudogemmobacter blasticus]|uniref:Methyltransferase type 11 domain-containing protein n=1 Tax=Fuscovulum blasticum DSM 2131 TaxID=1188250 RepID=A0A2T4JEZ0_FUSBL|nr:methyltransferase domain-containing protein [Fuscovulum blasticum]PTE16378.1 hypothetical protein C5F44_00505 [Fuscovulum blasticum DSM 2131]